MARRKNAGKNRIKEALKNGNDTIKMPGVEQPQEAPAEGERIPATEATYLAAQLHEVRSKLVNMRQVVIQKDQQLLQKENELLKKSAIILQLESKVVDEENRKLREEHGLKFDKTIHKDDETGEVYWLAQEKKAPTQ